MDQHKIVHITGTGPIKNEHIGPVVASSEHGRKRCEDFTELLQHGVIRQPRSPRVPRNGKTETKEPVAFAWTRRQAGSFRPNSPRIPNGE